MKMLSNRQIQKLKLQIKQTKEQIRTRFKQLMLRSLMLK
jgi:hypothetical protein